MDNELNQSKQERSRTRWTASLDKIFADLVLKHIQQGDRHNDVFDKKTWNHISDEFNRLTDLNFNNNQLRKHLDVLRTRFNNLKSSYDQNDIAGLEDACCIGFDLWEDSAAQPRTEPAKVKDCLIYEQLCAIFTDTSSTGKYAQSSHFEGLDKSVTARNESAGITSYFDSGTCSENPSALNIGQNTLVCAKPGKNTGVRKRKQPSEPHQSPEQSNKEEEVGQAMAEAMLEMVVAWKSRTGALAQTEDRFSITNCIRALDELEGINDSLYFDVLDLFENPNSRETFLSLDCDSKRLIWLLGKCDNPSHSGFF